MKLDSVLTVAIGDATQDGYLSATEWADFQDDMRTVLDKFGTVVAQALGKGVRSDDCVDEGEDHETESTCVFIVINHRPNDGIRAHVAQVLMQYGQSSACFAIDRAHEPVFGTKTGQRPFDNLLDTFEAELADAISDSPMFEVVGSLTYQADSDAAM